MATTVAFEMAAPVLSVTVPLMPPRKVCASRIVGVLRVRRVEARLQSTAFKMCFERWRIVTSKKRTKNS